MVLRPRPHWALATVAASLARSSRVRSASLRSLAPPWHGHLGTLHADASARRRRTLLALAPARSSSRWLTRAGAIGTCMRSCCLPRRVRARRLDRVVGGARKRRRPTTSAQVIASVVAVRRRTTQRSPALLAQSPPTLASAAHHSVEPRCAHPSRKTAAAHAVPIAPARVASEMKSAAGASASNVRRREQKRPRGAFRDGPCHGGASERSDAERTLTSAPSDAAPSQGQCGRGRSTIRAASVANRISGGRAGVGRRRRRRSRSWRAPGGGKTLDRREGHDDEHREHEKAAPARGSARSPRTRTVATDGQKRTADAPGRRAGTGGRPARASSGRAMFRASTW